MDVHFQCRKPTCSMLEVHRVGNDLVRVILRLLPGEQGSGAGVRHCRQVARRAGQTLPHNDRQLGSGTGCAKLTVSYALIVAVILQSQLVDEQHSGTLRFHPSERLDELAILQPAQHRRRLPRAVAQKSGCISSRQGHWLWGLKNHRRG